MNEIANSFIKDEINRSKIELPASNKKTGLSIIAGLTEALERGAPTSDSTKIKNVINGSESNNNPTSTSEIDEFINSPSPKRNNRIQEEIEREIPDDKFLKKINTNRDFNNYHNTQSNISQSFQNTNNGFSEQQKLDIKTIFKESLTEVLSEKMLQLMVINIIKTLANKK